MYYNAPISVPTSSGGVSDGDKGDITVSGGGTAWAIDAGAVTYAKMQDVSAASRLIGRGDSGSGDPQEITLGTNLSMSGTTLNASGGGGGSSATTVEVSLGTPKCCGRFTITDAAISSTSKVMCWQAPGPYTGKGTRADEAEAQPVQVIAVSPATGSAVVYWQTPPVVVMKQETRGSPKLNPAGATFDRLMNQRTPVMLAPTRIGKIRGNVKFSYVVFS